MKRDWEHHKNIVICTDASIEIGKGCVDYTRKSSEMGNIKFRRSLYFIKDMKPGVRITTDYIKSARPEFGIAPKYLEEIIGREI